MRVELITLKDGGVILAADQPFPHIVKRVEYYNDQRLMMIVYKDTDQDNELLHYEVPDEMVEPVVKSPNVIIYALFPEHEPIGYKAPLVKIGELY